MPAKPRAGAVPHAAALPPIANRPATGTVDSFGGSDGLRTATTSRIAGALPACVDIAPPPCYDGIGECRSARRA